MGRIPGLGFDLDVSTCSLDQRYMHSVENAHLRFRELVALLPSDISLFLLMLGSHSSQSALWSQRGKGSVVD